MGSQLVDRAFQAARVHNLTGQQARLLVFMAHTAHDSDARPRYWARWRITAAALGLTVPAVPEPPALDTTPVHSSVTKALRELTKTTPPLIERKVQGHRGTTAVYELHLPPLPDSEQRVDRQRETHHLTLADDSDRQRETDHLSSSDDAEKDSAFEHERQRVSALKAARNAPPEHQEHKRTPPAASKPAATVEGYPIHEHHPNALSALERISSERHLPIRVDDLMSWAYKIGTGNPWRGYEAIRAATDTDFTTNANDPRAVMLSRLRKLQDAPPATTTRTSGWNCATDGHKELRDGTCNHCADLRPARTLVIA